MKYQSMRDHSNNVVNNIMQVPNININIPSLLATVVLAALYLLPLF